MPTNQILQPAGKQVTFPGRPVDLLLIDDGRTLVVKNMRDLVFIDAGDRARSSRRSPLPAAAKGLAGAFSVVGLVAAGDRVLATDSQGAVRVAEAERRRHVRLGRALRAQGPGGRRGGLPDRDGARRATSTLWVCSSRGNERATASTSTTGEVEARVPVGVAPYMPVVVGDEGVRPQLGRRPPGEGRPARTSPPARRSASTRGPASPTTAASRSSTKAGDGWKQTKTIAVGLHPSGMAASPSGKFVYVANANSDTVSVIDTATDEVVETIDCRPEAKLPFGSGSNAVAVSPDGGTLYVANGTNNCVAVVRLGASRRPRRPAPAGREHASSA